MAGIVQETGTDCTLYKPGDEVYYSSSMVRPGGYSEYHLVDERIVVQTIRRGVAYKWKIRHHR